MNGLATLNAIVADNRKGEHRGIASWCTAHPDTLSAILRAHRHDNEPILIEATCNQVNQHGGYTGMTPAKFRSFVEGLGRDAAVNPQRIILGGDHLGPNPWKHLPASEAMQEARAMVKAYVEAGFSKIHLDASMACAGDGVLGEAQMAERAADLCRVAEAAAHEPLAYVIGTEVPIPGGETESLSAIAATRPAAVRHTYELHEAAFTAQGLGDALKRVIAVVVQPGVDFDNSNVTEFDAAKARDLIAAVQQLPGPAYEAHSTDYQPRRCLSDLVANHFCILKVGPELTFAYREAVFAMAAIEAQLAIAAPSNVIAVIDDVMNGDDRNWRPYVAAGLQQRALKLFGLSDRVRYYWPNPRITEAMRHLQANIDAQPVPRGLIAQYAGEDLFKPSSATLSQRIIDAKVGAVVRKYLSAARSASA